MAKFSMDWFFSSPTGIIDYLYLMDSLKNYKKPRSVLSSYLKEGLLIRVKKGLYVIGEMPFALASTRGPSEKIIRRVYSREMLANLIYGPSYISLEYALSYYGLIPEKVEDVTSITCNRNKIFNTPLGRFSYYYLRSEKYPVGVTYKKIDEKQGFLIATKEKALADCVARHTDLKNKDAIANYLFGLRIEQSVLAQLNLKRLREIVKIYQNLQVNLLNDLVKEYYEFHKRSSPRTPKKISSRYKR